ncbi:glycosyltransferase family 2 protein [Streptococcus suis]|uniref:glycosyltransferase family 2 protein n=1 Tax=Streptococcus suis TaxID=1307 RepID=UPI0038B91311
MSHRPFFSINIPVYNGEVYLEQALESCRYQTFQDFEIVLVDDCSTDRTVTISQKYQDKLDQPLRILSHADNKGELASRLTGYQASKGRYIVSLDHDDLLRKDCLEQIYNLVVETHADMVLYNFSEQADFEVACKDFPFTSSERIAKKDLLSWYYSQYGSAMWYKAFKRELAPTVEECGEHDSSIFGDVLPTIVLFEKCQSPYYLGENLYFHRIYEESKFMSLTLAKRYQIRSYLNALLFERLQAYPLEERNIYQQSLREVALRNQVKLLKNGLRSIGSYTEKYLFLKQLGQSPYFQESVDYLDTMPIFHRYKKMVKLVAKHHYHLAIGYHWYARKIWKLRKQR